MVEHYKKPKISRCDNVTYSMLVDSQVEFRHLPDGSVEWKYKGEKSYEWKTLIDNSNFPDFTWKEKEF